MKQKILKLINDIYSSNDIKLDAEETYKKLEKYVMLIIDQNKVMNLTAFNEEKIWAKGIYESLIYMIEAIKNYSVEKIRLLDIGAGVGFPSIPLKILIPKLNLDIFESRKKRCDFLGLVASEMNLKINIFSERIEESRKTEVYDVAVARAVAPLFKLIEMSHRIMKIGGSCYWIKGPSVNEEIFNSKKIVKKLKINLIKIKLNYEKDNGNDYIIKYEKTISTPKDIPRMWSHIK